MVPLAAILERSLGKKWENAASPAPSWRAGSGAVFSASSYGSAIESRFAKDVQEVPVWVDGGPEPGTVREGIFRADRLRTMRTRLSAAYKGIHVLLMRGGRHGFPLRPDRSTMPCSSTRRSTSTTSSPRRGAPSRKSTQRIYDCIINKTPLGARTNRIIGGSAPSEYLARIEKGGAKDEPIARDILDEHLRSHCIDPALLGTDVFTAFMADREKRLLTLIAKATGHSIVGAEAPPAEGEEVPDDMARDADPMPMAAE